MIFAFRELMADRSASVQKSTERKKIYLEMNSYQVFQRPIS